ncbi:MAG: O-antigen ligase family protein [bacterium]|nr:O-antigen ligase family protein [bacterium]
MSNTESRSHPPVTGAASGSPGASRLRRLAYKVSVFGGATAIVTFPVSVSLSQGGLALALLGWLLWALQRPKADAGGLAESPGNDDGGLAGDASSERLPFVRHPALLFAALIYGVELVALLINGFESNDFLAFVGRGYRTEVKDVFLVGMAFWTAAYAHSPENRKRLERLFLIALGIMIIAGLISIFSIYRLQKLPYHLTHGWEPGPNARYQHHVGSLFGGSENPLHLYMPIGLMNTHLTYGGILMMLFPVLVFRSLSLLLGPVKSVAPGAAGESDTVDDGDPGAQNDGAGPAALLRALRNVRPAQWIWPLALAAASLIFILNNGRSAIFGMLLATGFGFYVLARTGWRRRVLRLLPLILLAVASLVVLDRVSAGVHSRFEQIVGALFGREKHTDFQRTLVWQGALQLSGENPVFGVGPGNFEPSIIQNVVEYGQDQPHLWVAYELAQRGHAHNDMLHFLTIAGLPALLCYLAFFYFYVRHILRPSGADPNFWKWGPVAILGAGLFQCYFQDDEVLLPFWALVGFAISSGGVATSPSADRA